jgi:hypothetical protein
MKWKWVISKRRPIGRGNWVLECPAWGTGMGVLVARGTFEEIIEALREEMRDPIYSKIAQEESRRGTPAQT